MKFIKDILLFSLETTSNNPEKDSIIQLSAILLDKDNLLEKAFFNSYVRVSLLDHTVAEHAKLLDIPFDVMRKSQKIYDVVKKFDQQFGTDVLLATHTLNNMTFLQNAYKKTALPFSYDHHVIDLWTLGYIYLLRFGVKKMPSLTTFIQHFNLTIKNPRNALEKSRLSGEIFRRLINFA